MKLLVTLILSALLAVPALAEYKVATVDVNRLLNESKEAQSKRKELEGKSAEARKKIEEKSKSLKTMEEKIKESKDENSKEAQKFRSDARELDRMVKDSEEELRGEFLKFNKALAEKALKVISEYAKANQIDLVLDKGEKGRGAVLFGKAELDITDDVVKRLNQ